MKPETEQIVATLEMLTDGLCRSCVGDEPYGIIAWENEEKGEFNFLNFLLDVKALTPLEVEEFRASIHRAQSEKTIEQYEELIKLLESNLSHLQFYSYDAPYLSDKHTNIYGPYQNIEYPLIIGSTSGEEWLALAPKRFSDTKLRGYLSQEPTATTANLIEKIEIIADDLAHQTERRYLRQKEVKWEVVVASNKSKALEKVLDFAGYISMEKIDKFWDVEALEETGKYHYGGKLKELKLKQFFKQKLIDARVYYLYFDWGEYQVHYVIGNNKNGDWFGVFTDTYSW